MATQRGRKRSESAASPALENEKLIEALKFVSLAQVKDGLPHQTHCRISDHTIMAFDGGLGAGIRIESDIQACPHTVTFIAALSKCGEATSITMLDDGRLAVKSGKFKATVPCIPFGDIVPVWPDNQRAVIDDRIKFALGTCVIATEDNADRPFSAVVSLQASTAIATNGIIIIECTHGIDLPPGILIPRQSAAIIAKVAKTLSGFGFSDNSATFYFADDSFIRTALFSVKYPDARRVLDKPDNGKPIPVGMWDAVDKVLGFSEKGFVFLRPGLASSHTDPFTGASYEFDGIPAEMAFDGRYLKMIQPFADRIDFGADNGDGYVSRNMNFFGENIRGAIAKVSWNGR